MGILIVRGEEIDWKLKIDVSIKIMEKFDAKI